MSKSLTPYTQLIRIRGVDPVVHLRDTIGSAKLAVCGGSFSRATMSFPDVDTVPTCLWCVAGTDGSGLCWYRWADEDEET